MSAQVARRKGSDAVGMINLQRPGGGFKKQFFDRVRKSHGLRTEFPAGARATSRPLLVRIGGP